MLELKLVEVLKLKEYLVILLDEAGSRVLPVWVDHLEGQIIAASLQGQNSVQPKTYSLIDGK